MKRIVVFGRGGSGKSTLSCRLGEITGIAVIELDTIYWDENLHVLVPEEWSRRQLNVVEMDAWIIDGDLGPYDVTAPRLSKADTVIMVETPLVQCVWRVLRRGRQRKDFWLWMLSWSRTYKPQILSSIREYAPKAEVVTLSSARDVDIWLESCVLDQ